MKNSIFIFFLLTCVTASAQWSCIDSLAINPSFLCANTKFEPVCGCDNQTYRNDCEASSKYGVQTWTDGSCSGFEIDIIPTYDPSTLHFTLEQNVPNFVHLFVVDMYGKLWWQRNIPAIQRELIDIDIISMPVGTYILYVYDSKGTYRYKRFTRMPL